MRRGRNWNLGCSAGLPAGCSAGLPTRASRPRAEICHPERVMKLGIISDTHGLLRPEVAPALQGVNRILHLGDVGKPPSSKSSTEIAPVTAVRGNVDREGPCAKLPETEVVLIEGRYIYMLHDLKTLHLDPPPQNSPPSSHGHTHVPNFFTKKGVLYFNPGSCGPRRFELPVTVGLLTVSADGDLQPEIVQLPHIS
jgi:putative phosphoesterase